LSVKTGAVVFVICLDDGNGWSLISYHEKIGLVPKSYIQTEILQMKPLPKKTSTIAFDFIKTNAEEVNVKAGDEVTVFENLNDGWLKVSSPRGEQGIIPASYIRD
jgi:uncharacterized protein YgiM (DUF1202 family)